MPFGDCHQDSELASARFFGLFRREGTGSFVCSECKGFDHLMLLFHLCSESHLL